MITYGNFIKKIREKKGYSQRKLSMISGVSNTTIWRMENGETKKPEIESLKSIEKALNLKENTLIDVAYPPNEKKSVANTPSNNQQHTDIRLDTEEQPLFPEEFTTPEEARAYVNKHQIFGSGGFDADKLDDEEILEFANALLEQMQMVSYKYRK